jgi:hypothetical protein
MRDSYIIISFSNRIYANFISVYWKCPSNSEPLIQIFLKLSLYLVVKMDSTGDLCTSHVLVTDITTKDIRFARICLDANQGTELTSNDFKSFSRDFCNWISSGAIASSTRMMYFAFVVAYPEVKVIRIRHGHGKNTSTQQHIQPVKWI